jgi:hypothetical protein
MKQQQQKRTKWLTIRMTEDEYQRLEDLTRQTTCATLSEYTRKTVLGKPVILRYRNQSLDDFLADMLQLKKELSAIAGNFNQSVRRLQSLHKLPEIQQWILHNEEDKTHLFRQIEKISNHLIQTQKTWSQE